MQLYMSFYPDLPSFHASQQSTLSICSVQLQSQPTLVNHCSTGCTTLKTFKSSKALGSGSWTAKLYYPHLKQRVGHTGLQFAKFWKSKCQSTLYPVVLSKWGTRATFTLPVSGIDNHIYSQVWVSKCQVQTVTYSNFSNTVCMNV